MTIAAKRARRLPVLWILLATALFTLLVNLPLLYGFFEVHGTNIWKLWGYAPHQFVFLLVPVPLATFSTLLSLTIIFRILGDTSSAHPVLLWCGKNWIVIILLGFILSTTFAIFDYFFNPKVFDRFDAVSAQKAVSSADSLRQKIAQKPEAIDQKKWMRQADGRFDELKNASLTKEQVLGLEDSLFLRMAADSEMQRKYGLLHPIGHLLSEVQLVFALFVAFGTIFCAALVIVSGLAKSVDLSDATPALVTSLSVFALYPICFGYWSHEIAVLIGKPINNYGYLIAGGLALVVGGLLLIADIRLQEMSPTIARAIPLAISMLALAATGSDQLEKLRPLIGIDANGATRFYLFIGLLIIAIIASISLVVQYEREEIA